MELTREEIYSSTNLERNKEFWWKVASQISLALEWDWSYLLPFSVVKNSNSEEKVRTPNWLKKYMNKNNESAFIRWSASWDEKSIIWILKSITCSDFSEYEKICSSIITSWLNEFTKNYVLNYDNIKDYKWISSLMIAPKLNANSRNWLLWSIVGHPNMRNKFIVSFYDWALEYLTDENWKIIHINDTSLFSEFSDTNEHLQDILRMKHKTDEVGYIKNKISQTEFWIISSTKEASKLNESMKYFEFSWKPLTAWSLVSLQQREFREYDDYQYANDSYKFNSFWKFPEIDNKIHAENLREEQELEKLNEPFIFSLGDDTRFTSSIHNCKEYTLDFICKIINSKNLKAFEFLRRDWTELNFNNWSLWHWSYRFHNKWLPIKTIY